MYLALSTLLVAATIVGASTTLPQLTHGSDLATYVSRPDLRPPLYRVTHHDPDAITPGYWFVAPYVDLTPEHTHGEFQPGQIGPHIYDNDGNLVWSGACMLENRNTFDFKATNINDTTYLTFIYGRRDPQTEPYPKGAGIIADTSFKIRSLVNVTEDLEEFNMHEFNIIEEGKSSLIITYENKWRDISVLGLKSLMGWVGDSRIQEIDMATGGIKFEWRAFEHIPLTESYDLRHVEGGFTSSSFKWDYIHVNSVDKFQNGDYLVSGRYTNCIYRISGLNGSIIWRLGGKSNSFVLDGFNFSQQHDARIRHENSTVIIISFFDNAWDELGRQDPSAEVSSAYEVAIHTSTSPMTATLLNRWRRPDGRHTLLRGNTQILPNRNVFVGWSDQGYISEFAADDGRCILQAKWVSPRFSTYRAYKFNFTGSPTERPALKTFVYGSSDVSKTTTSIYYVSWNGATEVVSWNFYGAPNRKSKFSLVGSVAKKGFETTFMSTEYMSLTFAEAVAADGRSLGNSSVQRSISLNGAHDGISHFTITDAVHSAKENLPDGASRLTLGMLGPVTVVFIVIVSCFALAGMVGILHFLWHWRSWLPGGVYFPLAASSDTLDAGEMDDLSYRDEEAEKSGDSCVRRHSKAKRTD